MVIEDSLVAVAFGISVALLVQHCREGTYTFKTGGFLT
jgi:hypothetical protein